MTKRVLHLHEEAGQDYSISVHRNLASYKGEAGYIHRAESEKSRNQECFIQNCCHSEWKEG